MFSTDRILGIIIFLTIECHILFGMYWVAEYSDIILYFDDFKKNDKVVLNIFNYIIYLILTPMYGLLSLIIYIRDKKRNKK